MLTIVDQLLGHPVYAPAPIIQLNLENLLLGWVDENSRGAVNAGGCDEVAAGADFDARDIVVHGIDRLPLQRSLDLRR